MNKRGTPKEMVSTKNKNKVISCSTPEHGDSPSRDSDSICDSECASPVPFLCTQDGAEGETDVVWNFYTPKSGHATTSREKNSTPLSRRTKKSVRPKPIEKHIPKRRSIRQSQKKTQLFQELYELNQNLHELMAKKQIIEPEKPESGSEEDMFKTQEYSPKCIPRSSSRCLRKNVLSSNFGKTDPEAALESDDSMNECLLKASQIVEEKILKSDTLLGKKTKYENRRHSFKTDSMKLDSDSMDAIINSSLKFDSPFVNKVKKFGSPCLNNDSFDNFVGNLNDSALEHLTQMPLKTEITNNTKSKDWMVNELVIHDSSPLSKSFLSRHNSMPASPSLQDLNKPSTSGMSLGRFSSMPFHNEDKTDSGDSPIRCTPEEIKKKHQLARERLMAKRLPFTTQTKSLPSQLTQIAQKKTQFQPKVSSTHNNLRSNSMPVNITQNTKQTINVNVPNAVNTNNTVDLKQLIEKKRQEALMKLRRRQPPNK